jgi:hypothetical protein
MNMNYDQVVKHFGGELEAALALGKSHQTIKNWKDKPIPPFAQRFIERITVRKLKAEK